MQGVQPVRLTHYRWGLLMSTEKNRYIKVPIVAFRDREVSPSEQLFLGVVLGLMNNKEHCCYASNQYFAEECNTSTVVISRWIGRLTKKGYLRVVRDGITRQIFAGEALGDVVDNPVDSQPEEGEALTPELIPFNSTVNSFNSTVNTLNSTVNDPLTLELKPFNSTVNPKLIIDNRLTKRIYKKNNIKKNSQPADSIPEPLPVDNSPSETTALPETKKRRGRKPRAEKPASPDLPEDFLRFWKAYPRHLGYMRPSALEAWKSINPDEGTAQQILDGLNDWLEAWKAQNTEYQYIPIPANFLKQQRWLDGAEARRQSQRKAIGRNAYSGCSPEDYRAENDRVEMPPEPDWSKLSGNTTEEEPILFDT